MLTEALQLVNGGWADTEPPRKSVWLQNESTRQPALGLHSAGT